MITIKQLQQQLPHHLQNALASWNIKDTLDFPLALNVKMPTEHALDNAHLSFRFFDFNCINQGIIEVESKQSSNTDSQHFCLTIDKLNIKGLYAIDAKQAPIIDFDVGGNLMPFDTDANQLNEDNTTETQASFTPPQQMSFIIQARVQRVKLNSTENGRKLLAKFDEHNDVYNEMYKTNPTVIRFWKEGGIVAQMCKFTSDAVANNTEVNPSEETQTFGEGDNKTSYNAHAFLQATTLMSACLFHPDNDSGKYAKAGNAVHDMIKWMATTNNQQTQTTAMKPVNIYQAVETYEGSLSLTTTAEAYNMFSQGEGNGDEAMTIAKENGWKVYNEHERKVIKYVTTESQIKEEKLPACLWQGDCEAILSDIIIKFTVAKNNQQISIEQIESRAFDFSVDDKKWQGEAANIARERFAQLHFIRNLIQQQLSKGIEQVVTDSLNQLADNKEQ
jgi:hypothetical protein